MPKREVIHVTPDGRGGWNAKKPGATRASKNFDRKQDAVDYGRAKAKQATLGQLVIHKKDGKIQTEYTYGNDPFPPKG